MQKIYKIISFALALTVLFCALPMQVFADTANAVGYEELSDGYISVKVSKKNGGFLIDTVEGDKLNKADNNKFLLYPSDDFDTSYTTFRVTRDGNVNDYIFGRDYGFLGTKSTGVTLTKNSDSIEAKWSVDGLEFTQITTLENTKSEMHGMVRISYSVKSTDNRVAENIKARIMLDSALGYQDFAVYELTQADGSYTQVQNEALIDNADGTAYNNALFGYDDPKSPTVTAYTVNASVNDKIVKPYSLAFGHWNNLAATVFDFTPDESLSFTNPYNEKYLTADSAYALYFDMGAAAANGDASVIATNYGVYSNATVNNADKISINFSSQLGAMQLNNTKDAYLSQISGGADGDFSISAQIKNLSNTELKQIAVAVYPQEGITPYGLSGELETTASYSNPYRVEIMSMNSGEERQVTFKMNAEPLNVTDYRKIEIRCFDVDGTDGKLLSEKQIGTRSTYLLCPGATGDRISFLSLAPEIIYTSGTRHIYLAGQNFNLLKNKSDYDIKIKALDGSPDKVVSSENFILDTDKNTADVILDFDMNVGTYQIVFDMKDAAKKDITSESLKFNVSDDVSYRGGSYGIVTVEKAGNNKYALMAYKDENEYSQKRPDAQNIALLELRGDFSLKYENGKLVEAEAVSLETVDRKAKNTINISNCLDIEKGTVTVSVENPDADDQVINIDIDGEVYTTGARTKVWSGVCAISSFENGSESTLLQYTNEGEPTGDVENSVANTNGIMLMWPGAASTAQTIAGMIMEFRYCQFGQMALEDGEVTPRTPKRRIIAFGAQLSPDFLIPSNFKWSERETSTMEAVQLKIAKSNYTPEQLRDVQERYANDQEAWEEADRGSLSLYIHDILFGGGFIGFNTSVEVELPSYADGLPSIEGTLSLKVMDKEYTIGVEGTADMLAFEMEAALRLRSHNGIPIPDKLYFYAGGFTPGINVDGFGIFWIKGAGGGIDNLYETIYPSSSVPPITLLLSGQFALFDVLSARGDVSISPRALSIALSGVEVAGIDLIDYAGVECQWYPELKFAAKIVLDILDIIEGQGSIIVEKNKLTNKYFWEGFASASVSIPDKIPLFGGTEIGSAELGVNAEKIWGALHVIKLDAGITYYWGGDVDFAFGKYDTPEPTIELNSLDVPVYKDTENNRTLYMKLNNRIRTLASTDNIKLSDVQTKASIKSLTDKKTHIINLGSYSDENGVVTVTYSAPSKQIAQNYARNITIGGYNLIMTDTSKPADDALNANANTLLSWNESSKKATVTISVTDAANFNKDLTLKTPVSSSVTLYAMAKLPSITKAEFDADTKTVGWDGTGFDKFSGVAVYAVSADGKTYSLAEAESYADISKKSAVINIPENMPSGEYTIRVVGTTKDESSNPIVDAAQKLTYENVNQPSAPKFSAKTGGDYTIDLSGFDSTGYDGYTVNVYEVDNSGKNIPTVFSNIDVSDVEKSVITTGGRYSKTVTRDKNGKEINPINLTEKQLGECTTEKEETGLSAGKKYTVGLKGYKTVNGVRVESAETLSTPLTMPEPQKAAVELKAQNAVKINDVDTVKTADAAISVSSDIAVSGEWTLDGGIQSGRISSGQTINLSGIEDGTHTITFKGETSAGDSAIQQYLFAVDTLPPRLQISSPYNGGFFENEITVKGISDAGADVYVCADGAEPQKVTVGESGELEKTIAADTSLAYNNIIVYAADAIGNQSEPFTLTLTNKEISNPDSRTVICLNGDEYSGKSIAAGATGELSLAVKTADNKKITVNSDSAAANRINWNVMTVDGSAAIDENNTLTSDKDVNGYIAATFDGESAYAVIGGTSGDDPVIPTPDPSDNDKPNPSPTPGKNTSASSGDNTTIKKTANPFRDVSESDWFFDYVMYAYEKGLMKGTEADLFEPETDVTRAMFVTVLHRMEGTPRVGTVNFDDVDGGEYYADAVAWAQENKIVNGTTETTFEPNAKITREQMAAIVYRYARYKGRSIYAAETAEYIDSDSISDYAKDAVNWLSYHKILLGNADGTFAPQKNSTRAETAAVFQRIAENLK